MSDTANARNDSAPPVSDPPTTGPTPPTGSGSPVPRRILLHLLRHRGDLVRFEASIQTTEEEIVHALPEAEPAEVRQALRALVQSQRLLRRTQYVVGVSDPKTVYVLTTSGRRMALEMEQRSAEPAGSSSGQAGP